MRQTSKNNMARIAIKYDKITRQISGVIGVSVDTDLELNISEGEGFIEVPLGHPIISEQLNWKIKELPDKTVELLRKPQEIIDKEEADEKKTRIRQMLEGKIYQESPVDFLLQELNVLRVKAKELPLTKEQLQVGIEKIIQDKLKEI